MRRLLNFILQNTAFFTFLGLELLCTWLIIRNNTYQGAQFFNSSRAVVAEMMSVSQHVDNYLHLRVVNDELAKENARLRQQLEIKYAAIDPAADTSSFRRFDFICAKVVNNSVDLFRNYITINKGKEDGIAPGMAVISSNKAIGKVKVVSANFAVVISLLNLRENVSGIISRTGNFGSINWDGKDPRYTNFKFIPRHITPLPGDSVVTSGLNSVFPENILIGTISQTHLAPNERFWDITVELAQDFTRLQHVEVIRSVMKPEMDSLQNIVTPVVIK